MSRIQEELTSPPQLKMALHQQGNLGGRSYVIVLNLYSVAPPIQKVRLSWATVVYNSALLREVELKACVVI